jgi:alcohol dehydrogenase, propanol-preferring
MKAMLLKELSKLDGEKEPLELADMPEPQPSENELLIKISACAVCHTELDEIEGRIIPVLPIIPGHQVVGRVVRFGNGVKGFSEGERVGIAWIYSTCGTCEFCQEGNENLCQNFKATGKDVNGGYAEYMTIQQEFVYRIPAVFSDIEAATHLCAGAIGFRSLRLSGHRDGQNLGLTGFGSSGHLVLKMVKHWYPSSRIFVFTRNSEEREFARELGAEWAGDTEDISPDKLHNIIDTTPVWKPVVEALKNLRPGGRLIINAVRKEDSDKDFILNINYPSHLWHEKEIKSVANVTRWDVQEYLELASQIPIKPEVEIYVLEEANKALMDLKRKSVRGSKVLKISDDL